MTSEILNRNGWPSDACACLTSKLLLTSLKSSVWRFASWLKTFLPIFKNSSNSPKGIISFTAAAPLHIYNRILFRILNTSIAFARICNISAYLVPLFIGRQMGGLKKCSFLEAVTMRSRVQTPVGIFLMFFSFFLI